MDLIALNPSPFADKASRPRLSVPFSWHRTTSRLGDVVFFDDVLVFPRALTRAYPSHQRVGRELDGSDTPRSLIWDNIKHILDCG
jgi:hypothetical protein